MPILCRVPGRPGKKEKVSTKMTTISTGERDKGGQSAKDLLPEKGLSSHVLAKPFATKADLLFSWEEKEKKSQKGEGIPPSSRRPESSGHTAFVLQCALKERECLSTERKKRTSPSPSCWEKSFKEVLGEKTRTLPQRKSHPLLGHYTAKGKKTSHRRNQEEPQQYPRQRPYDIRSEKERRLKETR